jgi:hypothetical protein
MGTHMRGTRIENKVEIYATNLANGTECMSTNAYTKWGEKCEDIYCLPLAPCLEKQAEPSNAAPLTQAQSPTGFSRKIKISPTCL